MKKSMSMGSMIIVVIALIMGGFLWKEAQAKEPRILKLGFAKALTGPAADWFIPMLNGLELGADRINSKGGVEIGGDKYLIKFIKENTHFTSDGAKAAAEKLVYRHKVKYIWGAGVSHTTLPLQDVTKPNKVININSAWEKLALSGKKEPYKYTFKALATPHESIRGMWRYIKKAYPHVKRVAIIVPETLSSHYGTRLEEILLPTIDLDLVFTEYFEWGMKDFYPILSRALATRPDVIQSTDAPPSAWGLIIKQAREMGYKGLFMQEIPTSGELFNIAGKENCEGLITYDFLTYGPNATPEYKDFRRKFEKKYGKWWPLAPTHAQMLGPLLKAMQIAGTVEDTDKVLEILTSRTFKSFGLEGRTGGVEYYGVPNMWAAPLLISEVKGGEFRAVDVISVEEQLYPW